MAYSRCSGFDRRFALLGLFLALGIIACSSADDRFNGAMSPSSNASGGSANDSVQVPQLFPPELVGPLVGPEAAPIPDLKLFGTDLGLTFVHAGRHEILFGDTMPYATFYCDNHDPVQDDSLATLPLSPPSGVPPLDFVKLQGDPSQYATLALVRGGTTLPTGLGATPGTGFSDGQHAFAVIGHLELTSCRANGASGFDCDSQAGLTCTHDVGTCSPLVGNYPTLCDVATGQGCALGQQCIPRDDGYCADLTSSQYDGTPSSVPFTLAHDIELSVQHDDDPAVFDSVYTFATTKFNSVVARTVSRLSDARRDDDFSPGTGGLLMWGRPGFSGEDGRQSQLYLLKHTLPLPLGSDGTVAFAPQYFAGVDARTGEPRWSAAQRDAVAIAMDGKRNGSPSEPIIVVNQFAMSWLGPR